MTAKLKARIIINPISGGREKKDIPGLLQQYLDQSKFETEFCFTQSAEHARELAQEAVSLKRDLVIAAGGDGTLNLTASGLINSEIPMGIIPLGSGNGFARALNIPMNTIAAIKTINTGKPIAIDSGMANQIPFINVCGFGFDAHVSSKFAEAGTRGLKTYAKISIKELHQYQNKNYQLEFEHTLQKQNAFILAICNGPQYGNNAFIAPLAEFSDGQFDISILEKVNWKNVIPLSLNLFLKKLYQSKNTKHQRAANLTVMQESAAFVNIDGEPIWFEEKVTIQLLPKSLQIIVP